MDKRKVVVLLIVGLIGAVIATQGMKMFLTKLIGTFVIITWLLPAVYGTYKYSFRGNIIKLLVLLQVVLFISFWIYLFMSDSVKPIEADMTGLFIVLYVLFSLTLVGIYKFVWWQNDSGFGAFPMKYILRKINRK